MVDIRVASPADAPQICSLIDVSIRVLGGLCYSQEQVESSLIHLFGVDSTMIGDGTYFVAQDKSGSVVGAGGWSWRKTPFGGDSATAVRDTDRRIPGRDPAVIRAFYVHPNSVRQGIGRRLLAASESAAAAAGFVEFELVATMSGLPFYRSTGYESREEVPVELPDGVVIPCLRMWKRLGR